MRAVPMEQLYALMEQKLVQGGSVVLPVTGVSMYPMLAHQRDSVTLCTANSAKKGELIFFRRENGSFVLHRVVRVLADGEYLCCGDNQHEPERVADSQILAVVTEFTRNGKVYPVDAPGYQAYVTVWGWLFPVRRPLLAARRVCGKVRRKLNKSR